VWHRTPLFALIVKITHVFKLWMFPLHNSIQYRIITVVWPIICTIDSLNTVRNAGCSLQVLEILLEAVDFQNRKQVLPGHLDKPISRTTGPGLTQLSTYIACRNHDNLACRRASASVARCAALRRPRACIGGRGKAPGRQVPGAGGWEMSRPHSIASSSVRPLHLSSASTLSGLSTGHPRWWDTPPLDVTLPLEGLDLAVRGPDVEKNRSCALLQLDASGSRFQEVSQMSCRIAVLLLIFDISKLFCRLLSFNNG
jgi:hypothetical protein